VAVVKFRTTLTSGVTVTSTRDMVMVRVKVRVKFRVRAKSDLHGIRENGGPCHVSSLTSLRQF